MGRRTRKRGSLTTRAERDAAAARAARPRAAGRARERPRHGARWGSFPLSELVILLGIVVMVWGFLSGSGPRARSGWRPGCCWPRWAAASWRCASTWPASARTRRCWRAWRRSRWSRLSRSALGPVKVLGAAADRARRSSAARSTRCASCSSAAREAWASGERAAAAARRAAPRDADLRATSSARSDFYRNLLGMSLVEQTVNEDDRAAPPPALRRRAGPRRARSSRAWSTRSWSRARSGVGSTHHFALAVELGGGAGGLARLPARARHAVHRGDGAGLLQVDLPARSRRPHPGAGHGGAWTSAAAGLLAVPAAYPLSSVRRRRAAARASPKRARLRASLLHACRGVLRGQDRGQRQALALGERPDLLVLGNAQRTRATAGSGSGPSASGSSADR